MGVRPCGPDPAVTIRIFAPSVVTIGTATAPPLPASARAWASADPSAFASAASASLTRPISSCRRPMSFSTAAARSAPCVVCASTVRSATRMSARSASRRRRLSSRQVERLQLQGGGHQPRPALARERQRILGLAKLCGGIGRLGEQRPGTRRSARRRPCRRAPGRSSSRNVSRASAYGRAARRHSPFSESAAPSARRWTTARAAGSWPWTARAASRWPMAFARTAPRSPPVGVDVRPAEVALQQRPLQRKRLARHDVRAAS